MPLRCGRRDPPTLPLLLALTLLATHKAVASGVFELQVLEFSNPRGRLANGACCGPDAAGAPDDCRAVCRTQFSLCLREYQAADAGDDSACAYGALLSGELGVGSFSLPETAAPLRLAFTFRWTRAVSLLLRAIDSEGGGELARARWAGLLEPGLAWHVLRATAPPAALVYRVRVLCQENYYGDTCTRFCRKRDDAFGHYRCLLSGDKECLPGWRGPNCETPVCKEGCHPEHGHCSRPGDCDCRPGWRGELCSACRPYPGCKHGSCNDTSWDCTCDTNWGGILCDQDLNYCGTHEPCQHGGTCENTAPDQYLCSCAEGFSGSECERVDNPCATRPCAAGVCRVSERPPGFECECREGWAGPLCDRDVDECAARPCANGATCRDRENAFLCDCAPGWRGLTCIEDVDECAAEGVNGSLGVCVNAVSCENIAGGYRCGCVAGWEGERCDRNVDDCSTRPCAHGATCIDLVGDFHCACVAGYAGRRCELDVDDCASRPCRHGGECRDLLDDFRCICPAGYSGDLCEDDRDHCASAPCENGAACYSAQGDYYCRCGAGWSGRRCELRTAVTPCASRPCSNNATCINAGLDYHCDCREGWTGKTCSSAVVVNDPPEAISCECLNGGVCAGAGCACTQGWKGAKCETRIAVRPPACPPAAALTRPPGLSARCVCRATDPRQQRRCLESIGERDHEEPPRAEEGEDSEESAVGGAECGAGGAWWWGCNVCWCGAAGTVRCTRVWCGLLDCAGGRAVCRDDEVCVPVAGALCLRPPCPAPAECRRVTGRRVDSPALPSPASCWPGASTVHSSGRCVTADLQLARESVLPGAHVETACGRLRRALAASLAGDTRAARHELVLLCDLSQTDDDTVDLALWVSDDEGTPQSGDAAVRLSAEASRALVDLVARRRATSNCPLLSAALRLRVRPRPAAAPVAPSPGPALLAVSVVVPLSLLVAGVLVALCVRRRRVRSAARERERDNKTNNLQNEENLRRYSRPASSPQPLRHPYKPQNNADKPCCQRDSLTVIV